MTTTHQEQQEQEQQHYGNSNSMTNEVMKQHSLCYHNEKNKTRTTKASQKGQQQIKNNKSQMK